MNIRFCVEYFADNNQTMHIVFGDGKSLAMQLGGNGLWSVSCNVKSGESYHYELRQGGKIVRAEQTMRKTSQLVENATVYDCWWDTPQEQPFYSALFCDVILQRKKLNRKHLKPTKDSILIEVDAPTLLPSERLSIVGGCSVLGGWDANKAAMMNDAAAPTWRISLPREVAGSEYKFIITDNEGNLKSYEQGANRLIPYSDSTTTIIRGLRFRTNPESGWRGAGVAIPVFSLRSKKSWGVGEFSDLKLMARWAKRVGLSVIQVLPVNDTTSSLTWRDSYPYNAISSFALHPLYLGAEAAVKCCKTATDAATQEQLQSLMAKYSPKAAKLNALRAVDYDKCIKLKLKFLKDLYKLCGKQVMATKQFLDFVIESEEWLMPYATYCALRDKHPAAKPNVWGEAAYDYALRHEKEVGFYCFVQYLLDVELREASNYAHSLGVALKGDIPIGVSLHSVDVWCGPELYNTSMSAGAPPDAFAEEGQNWGFPTYNWAKMAEDGYDWWLRRLQKMARYFDAYRIDHILGFFRIWETPRDFESALMGHFYPSMPYSKEEIAAAGLNSDFKRYYREPLDLEHYNGEDETDTLFVEYPEGGYVPRIEGYKTKKFKALTPTEQQAYMQLHEEFFYHRHNDFWRACALKRLPALMKATKMLTCGEDLGMIPACVPEVMQQEGILSLEIERMPKQMGVAFGDTRNYPYFSVTATSTHDMSNIRGWWREDKELTQRYWNEVLHLEGVAEKECSGSTARLIIEQQMRSNAILAILPLQDWLATDESLRQADPDTERINIPANPHHYWRYRMHLTLEQLLAEEEFNNTISSLVALRQ